MGVKKNPATARRNAPSRSKNESQTVVKLRKTKRKEVQKADSKQVYKKCKEYHLLKREILAPFITKLLISHAWESITSDLDAEGTVFDTRILANGNNDSREDMTLGKATVQEDESSYQEDWRNENGHSSDSSA